MTVRIGLTGSIGAGKSTVAATLRAHGVDVIDADELAREAMRDPEVVRRLQRTFAEVVEGESVDRSRLARIVFGDDEARRRLEAIVHPVVERLRHAREEQVLRRRPPPEWIVHDVPLLFEVGMDRAVDAVVVVDASWRTRLERLAARSGWTEREAQAREDAQMPPEEKRARADVVLDNDGDVGALEPKVMEAFRRAVAIARARRAAAGGAGANDPA